MAKNLAVFGIYKTQEALEAGIDRLREADFRNTDISVLFPENVGNKDLAPVKATKAPEGASTGAGAGVLFGGTLGWLAGIGALAIPGLGPFIAAGPIVGALAGAGAGAAVGGLTGALIGFGMPEYEAKRYEGLITKGDILISVHADDRDWARRAETILKETGAADIATTGESKGDIENTEKPMYRGGTR